MKALVLLLLCSAPLARGQAALRWAYVGDPNAPLHLSAKGLALSDTAVYATGHQTDQWGSGDSGVFVIRPGGADWQRTSTGHQLSGDDVTVIAPGELFLNRSGLQLSENNGQTFHEVADESESAPVRTPSGALVMGEGDCCGVARSADDGRTWTAIETEPGLGFSLVGFSFVALGPRLLVAGAGGLAYSDDDGLSWRPTALVADFRYYARSVVASADGYAYAAVNDFQTDELGVVYRSADGAAWERRGQIPFPHESAYKMAAAPDGVIWAIADGAAEYAEGVPPPTVYRSADGGATWEGTGPVWTEWPIMVNEIALDVGGFLWLAATQGEAGPGRWGGVFRTADPVFQVANEPPPPAPHSALEIEVAPNPSGGGHTRITLRSRAAAPACEVAVYDALGRRVAVLFEGAVPAGGLPLEWRIAGAPPGVYTVRATTADGAAATAVVVRR